MARVRLGATLDYVVALRHMKPCPLGGHLCCSCLPDNSMKPTLGSRRLNSGPFGQTGGKMRFPFIAATIVALSLIACNGLEESTSEVGSENTSIETPEATESSPTDAPPTRQSPENTLIETPEYTGVIISENGASEFSYKFDKASTSFWEPSTDDVSRAEECIRQFLVSTQDDPKLHTYQKEKTAFILENLEKYRRQYVGIVVDGEKRIWCNAFFTDYPIPNWEHVPVEAIDGGEYFWQIEYILLKDECINFYIQGEA
jgi:hypothetical protein